MESVFILVAVAGAVELINRVRLHDWYAAVTIVIAGAIGALTGLFGIDGVSVVTGIELGLGASGLVTVVGKLSTNTPAIK
jgi:hypothetical protein